MELDLQPVETDGGKETKLKLEPLDLEPIEGEKKKTGSPSSSPSSEVSGSEVLSTQPKYEYQWSDSKPPITTSIHPARPKTTEEQKFKDASQQIATTLLADQKLYKSPKSRNELKASLPKDLAPMVDKHQESIDQINTEVENIKKDPNNFDAKLQVANHLHQLGRTEESQKLLKSITEQNPSYSPAYSALAYQYHGDPTGAQLILDEGIKNNPADPSLFNNRAIFKEMGGDMQGAIKDLNLGIDLAAKSPHVLETMYAQRARIYDKLSKDKTLAQTYIDILKGQHDPIGDQINQEWFNEQKQKDFAMAANLVNQRDEGIIKSTQPDKLFDIKSQEEPQTNPVFDKEKIKAHAGLIDKIVNPSTSIPDYILGYAEHAGKQVVEGTVTAAEGLSGLMNAHTPKEAASNALDALKGTTEAVFGGISFTPAGIAFNVAADKLIPEKVNKWVFSAPTQIMDAFGYKPEKGSLAEKALSVGDIAVSLWLLHKSGEVTSKISDKIKSKEPLTIEEGKQVKDVIDTATPEDLHAVFEQNGYEHVGKPLEKFAEQPTEKDLRVEKVSVQKNMLAEKRPDLKDVVDNAKTSDLIADMDKHGYSPNPAGMEKYFDKVKIGEIKMPEEKVQEQPAVSVADKSRYDELSKEDPELLSADEKSELKVLSEKQVPVKVAVASVKEKIAKPEKEGPDYSKGKTAEEYAKEEKVSFTTPDESVKYVAEKSENPLEIVKAQQSLGSFESKKGYEDQVLEDVVNKVDPGSYARFGDPNNVTQTMAKRFFEKGGRSLDELAQEASDMAGKEITPENIVNFIDNYSYERKTNPLTLSLKERFKSITGKDLNEKTANEVLDQELNKYTKEHDKFLNKESVDYATAEKQFYDEIKSGEIPIEESTEVSPAERHPEGAAGAENSYANFLKGRITEIGEGLKSIPGFSAPEGTVRLGGSPDMAKLIDKAVKLIHKGIDAGVAIDEAIRKAIEQIKTTDLYGRISGTKDFKAEEFDKSISDQFKEASKVPTREEAVKQSEEFTSKQSPEQERKSFIDTVKQGDKTTEGMKAASADLDEFYKTITNKETLKKVDAKIREDIGEAKKEVLSDSSPNANKSAMAVRLIKHYESIKDYDTAIDVLDGYDKQLRAAGQFIQAASLWNKLSPETMVRNANKAFRKIGKKEDLPKGVQKVILEKMHEIDKMVEGDEKTKATLEMLNFIADQMPLTFKEKFDAYRYQNMLSNPRTHERNISNNLLQTFITRPLDLISVSAYDLFRNPFNPVARDYKLSNAPSYLQSAITNIPNAWAAAAEAFRQGYVADKIMDIGNTSTMIEAMRRTKLPKTLTFVSRFMEAQDRFFSTIIAESEKVRLLEKGMSESEATIEGKKVGEHYMYRDKMGVNEQDMPILSRALDQAGKWIIKGRNETVLGQALSWFVPFVTTPINVAKFGIERSPLGFIGGKYGKTQVANAMIGTMVTGIGAMLAAQDQTTWAAPRDKKERELFYASGKKPYSIKINDAWVPLQYFGPYALALALPAAYKNFKYDTKTAATADEFDMIKDATIGIGGYIAQQTPLSGLGGLMKSINGEDDFKLASVMGFASEQVIPLIGLVKYVNSWLDPVYRKSNGYLESIEKDLPELSKKLDTYPSLNSRGREDKNAPPPSREPVNYWLPYDVGFDDKAFDLLLKKRRALLQKRAVRKEERESKKEE